MEFDNHFCAALIGGHGLLQQFSILTPWSLCAGPPGRVPASGVNTNSTATVVSYLFLSRMLKRKLITRNKSNKDDDNMFTVIKLMQFNPM